jgi:phosphoadenosine phosphosulfate reductase family protein
MQNHQEHFFGKIETARTLIWFSAGATSAVAAALALKDESLPADKEVIYQETGSHNSDNLRFLADCEKWLGVKIKILQSPKFASVDEVIERERYINGPTGAKCTQQLKVEVRRAYQRTESDIQVFGFHAGEIDRAADYSQKFPEVQLRCPLIQKNLFHDDCLALIRDVGIELPLLYRLGFKNNNCEGCVKGGRGYWNKVRVLMPLVFAKRARQEREIGHSCIKGMFLDELDPSAGRYEAEPDISCEGACAGARQEIEHCET